LEKWRGSCEAGFVQLRKHRDFAAAADRYQDALRYRQDIASVWHGLGVALIEEDELTNGIQALQKAYELDPDYCFLRIPRVFMERKREKTETASPAPEPQKAKGFFKKLFGG
jgi:tetratricopeptide (TPR) repeat protein